MSDFIELSIELCISSITGGSKVLEESEVCQETQQEGNQINAGS